MEISPAVRDAAAQWRAAQAALQVGPSSYSDHWRAGEAAGEEARRLLNWEAPQAGASSLNPVTCARRRAQVTGAAAAAAAKAAAHWAAAEQMASRWLVICSSEARAQAETRLERVSARAARAAAFSAEVAEKAAKAEKAAAKAARGAKVANEATEIAAFATLAAARGY